MALDNDKMKAQNLYCQCVRIGDEALISSGFLPSGNGAHTPGRLEQIRAFCVSGGRTPSDSKGRYLAAWKEMADFTNPGTDPPPINPVLQ